MPSIDLIHISEIHAFYLRQIILKSRSFQNADRPTERIVTASLIHSCKREVLPMVQNKQLSTNRNYKDTIFRMLFSDRKNLLSLYNAVSGSHYDDPEKLEIVTLENAIYMGMKNDLAFIIGTDLFLYEHQSTYNPNMPLRDLFYISSEYQKLVDHKSLYSSTLLKIPAPQFIVFYNGTEKKKDHWVNHLSESFENLSGEPKLELEVLTININEGLNKELMEQCQTLREYAQIRKIYITIQYRSKHLLLRP